MYWMLASPVVCQRERSQHTITSHKAFFPSLRTQQIHVCHLDSFTSIMFSTRSTTQTVLSFRFQKLPCPIPLRGHCVKWESSRRERGGCVHCVQRGNTEDISIIHISAPWPVSHPFKRATTDAGASDTSRAGA